MSKQTIFQTIISDFFTRSLEQVRPRALGIPLNVPKVVSLLGPRRAGKTYVLFDIINRLREEVEATRLVYVNFEDDRLFPLTVSDLDDLVTGYFALYPEHKDQLVWFFLDEVQDVPHWEKFVRRLHDQENCRIYITGSSSKLLSRELATSLRGRTLPFDIFPLSFTEFLEFNEVSVNPRTSKGQALLLHWMDRYLSQGGFPELVQLPVELHRRTITEYVDLMLYRDLSERFSLKNPSFLKYLLKHLLVNVAKPVSLNKLYRDLKSQGYSVGKNTIFDYVSYLEEAFAIFQVDMWSTSIRQKAVNPRKFYTVDPAYKHIMSISEDRGRLFENMVFMELRRKGIHPSYWLDGQEVDFYWEGGRLINVCYDLSDPDTRNREIKGLAKAMKQTGEHLSLLLTWNEQETISLEEGKIEVQPLWMYLTMNG